MRLAIDIGSTIINFHLIEKQKYFSILNPQTKWFANTLSRASCDRDNLKRLRDELYDSIKKQLDLYPEIDRICFSSNSIIASIFQNKGMEGFIPPYKKFSELCLTNFDFFKRKATYLPCFYPFFGADALGLMFDNMGNIEKEPFIGADFGTNCEIVAFDGNRFVATSVPAGPAFEGEELSCGMPAINGAIKKVNIINNIFSIETIGSEQAKGICGSGIFSLIAVLKRNNLIDSEGHFKQSRFLHDNKLYITPHIYFTAHDMEEVLKAWSSVKTAFRFLKKLLNFNKKPFIKLSGNFIMQVDINDLITLNFVDENELVVKSGNTSLNIAYNYLIDSKKTTKYIEFIKNNITYMYLAKLKNFDRIYWEEFHI